MKPQKKAIFYPRQEAEIITYYDTVVKALIGVASKYNIPTGLLNELTDYSIKLLKAKQKSDADQLIASASVEAKNKTFEGARSELVRELKRLTDLEIFDEADAKTMGIRKEVVEEDISLAKAIISSITVLPDEVVLDWVKGKMDGVVIYSSFDGAGFEQIGIDIRSPYEDRRRNKIAGQPEVRYYKLRYLKNDKEIGLFSDVVCVAVLI